MRILLAALALAAAVAARAGDAPPAGGEGAPPDRIRLHRLEVRGVDAPLAGQVESRLCQALADASRRDVLCPDEAAALAEAARQSAVLGGCSSDECVRRAEQATAAAFEVRATLARQGDGLRLTLALAGPAGRTARTEATLPAALEQLTPRLAPLARALLAAP